MELTVLETFHVFGMLLYMTKKEILERMEELMCLLELPGKDTQIYNLRSFTFHATTTVITSFRVGF